MKNAAGFTNLVRSMVACAIFLCGCAGASPPSRFYMLSPAVDPDAEAPVIAPSLEPLSLRIGPVEIPDALNRNELVTRLDRNRVALAPFDLWAGSLKQNFHRVLSENLSILLSTDRVVPHTFRTSMPVDYQIRVEVIQFDGKPGDSALLIARWSIHDGKKKTFLFMEKSRHVEPASPGYDGLVAAQSNALAGLSRDIARAVAAISRAASDEKDSR